MDTNTNNTNAFEAVMLLLTTALAASSPAEISLAHEDMQWLVTNDEEKRSFNFWFSKSMRDGAKACRRSVQYTLDNKRRAKNEDKQKANEENFTKYLLNNPETAADLPKLLVIATAFEIPVNIVMAIHNRAIAVKADHESKKAAEVPLKAEAAKKTA